MIRKRLPFIAATLIVSGLSIGSTFATNSANPVMGPMLSSVNSNTPKLHSGIYLGAAALWESYTLHNAYNAAVADGTSTSPKEVNYSVFAGAAYIYKRFYLAAQIGHLFRNESSRKLDQVPSEHSLYQSMALSNLNTFDLMPGMLFWHSRVAAFAILGAGVADIKVEQHQYGVISHATPSETFTSFRYGLGTRMAVTKHLQASLSLLKTDFYNVKTRTDYPNNSLGFKSYVKNFSVQLGVSYNFY
jgi:hypothetical protein